MPTITPGTPAKSNFHLPKHNMNVEVSYQPDKQHPIVLTISQSAPNGNTYQTTVHPILNNQAAEALSRSSQDLSPQVTWSIHPYPSIDNYPTTNNVNHPHNTFEPTLQEALNTAAAVVQWATQRAKDEIARQDALTQIKAEYHTNLLHNLNEFTLTSTRANPDPFTNESAQTKEFRYEGTPIRITYKHDSSEPVVVTVSLTTPDTKTRHTHIYPLPRVIPHDADLSGDTTQWSQVNWVTNPFPHEHNALHDNNINAKYKHNSHHNSLPEAIAKATKTLEDHIT